jgi:fatty acid desaturase
MNHIFDFICNHQLFAIIANSNLYILKIFMYVGLIVHFIVMFINLILFRFSDFIIVKKDTYIIASIIYMILQTIVSYIICLLFIFFGWFGLFLIVLYFVSYVIIAKIKDESDKYDTFFVFGLGEYPFYLSEKSHHHKILSDNYKKFKEKNKEIV